MAPIIMIDAADGPCAEERHENPRRLRELAHWYREFADRAGNPVIWEARLRTAKELEQEADRLEEESAQDRLGHRIEEADDRIVRIRLDPGHQRRDDHDVQVERQ